MTKKPKREKISLLQITEMFPDNDTAEKWFIKTRWNDDVECPQCGSHEVSERTTKIRSWRCKECRKDFSTKTGTLMQGSKLGFRTWAIAIYLVTTSLKGISSTKLASDLNITQKSAWHLSMRIRETYKDTAGQLSGVVEVDETYIGGLEKNKHEHKKQNAGRGTVGKKAVVGAKQRNGEIVAKTIEKTTKKELHGFIGDVVEKESNVVTDDHRGYLNMNGYKHHTVCHSVGEYVKGQAHTNGIESFWALLKRGYHGTHHYMSFKHLGQYVNEFAGRHNTRGLDTIDQMVQMSVNMSGKQLRYKDLVG
ncbi:MAG: IS1595 family transposase [Alphaproteobacteria bacterium]